MRSFKPVTPNAEVLSLLTGAGLPTSDLKDSAPRRFCGLYQDDVLIGAVGVELHLPAGLLRSLVVAPSHRGLGAGASLLDRAERLAADAGVRDLFLLTTNSSPLFERHGYRHVARAEAPPSISQSQQFSGICPETAAFMVKRLK